MDDFCYRCGAIKVVAARATFTQCGVCGNREDVSKLVARQKTSTMEILFRGEATIINTENKLKSANKNRVIERTCRKCEKTTDFTYTTMQTRSADEGQTVFYTCTVCNETEIEYA